MLTDFEVVTQNFDGNLILKRAFKHFFENSNFNFKNKLQMKK